MITKADAAYLATITDGCWSCGASATRPDGLCADCGAIDPDGVPDLSDPDWKGNTKPFEAIFEAPPSAKRIK